MRPAKEVHYSKKMALDKVLTFSFSNIFRQFEAYSQWLLLSLIIVFINLVPVGIMLMGIDFSGSIPIYAAPEEIFSRLNVGMIGVATVFFIIAVIVDIIFSFYSKAWLYRTGLDGYDYVKRSFGERFKKAFNEVLPVAAASLLIGIGIFLFMMPYMITNTIGTLGNNSAMLDISFLLYIFYYVMFFFITVKFSCTIGLIMDGNEGIIESLKKSWAMTKGRGWRIFGYMVVIGILQILLAIAIIIPAIIIWAVAAVAEFTPALLGVAIIFSILTYMILICIQLGIGTNIQVAVYKLLCIEHEEYVPVPVEAEGSDTSLPNEETSYSAPKDDEIKF